MPIDNHSQPLSLQFRRDSARRFCEQGDYAAAETLLCEGLAAQPESVSLGRELAFVLANTSRYQEAIEVAHNLIWPLHEDTALRSAYAAWLVHWREQLGENAPQAAIQRLKTLWSAFNDIERTITNDKKKNAPLSALDADHLRGHFDSHAEIFDELLGELDYRAPEMLYDAVTPLLSKPGNLDIIDLGCGTGLVGIQFKHLSKHLLGIDFAPYMLMRARRRGVYDTLIEGDVIVELARQTQPADLILAADLLIYVGDCEVLFRQASKTLRPGGHLAVTTEKLVSGKPEFSLLSTQRYAHSEAYIFRIAKACEFEILYAADFDLRREGTEIITGQVFVMQKK